MQRLEDSGAVRPIYGSLGVKRLTILVKVASLLTARMIKVTCNKNLYLSCLIERPIGFDATAELQVFPNVVCGLYQLHFTQYGNVPCICIFFCIVCTHICPLFSRFALTAQAVSSCFLPRLLHAFVLYVLHAWPIPSSLIL